MDRPSADLSRRLAPNWFARARLKLRHLQLLAALDETRNLNRAALGLGITQPAASKLLAEVEQMVGASLFERRPRGLVPNLQGEALARRARSALVELEQAAVELNSLEAGSGGRVALGSVTAPAVDIVVRAVEAVLRAHPALEIAVEVDSSPALVARLLEGRLDFVLARIPLDVEAAGLEYREVAEEALCLLVLEGHPLLARETVAPRDLLAYGWVLPPPGSLMRQEVERLFRRHGLPGPERVLNTDSVLLGLAALVQGPSICVVTASVAQLLEPGGRYRRLPPLEGGQRLAVPPFGLIRSRVRPLSPAAGRLYDQVAAQLFGGGAASPEPPPPGG
ncbi:LysR family transcriptional regulator [Roseomonas sp. M0104]|uniref:LysR family transcriptional regulator n=1 Tax=Teichococcus coralli TaxID=2545983 RepID=A0A845BAH9_9PROT|nr:LysR family transcriptional regulator [Pseudoroseomonas coralli]MXP64181.1 LysR family transcriptional regulator [Pseudoroseomonas coralli]